MKKLIANIAIAAALVTGAAVITAAPASAASFGVTIGGPGYGFSYGNGYPYYGGPYYGSYAGYPSYYGYYGRPAYYGPSYYYGRPAYYGGSYYGRPSNRNYRGGYGRRR